MNEFEKFNPDTQFTAPKPEKESRPNQPESIESQDNTREKPPAREPFEKTPEELKKIEEIRRQLQENTPTLLSKQEVVAPQNPTEIETIKGQRYTVEYVPKEDIYPAYGHGGENSAVVRQDLPPRVKNFVKAHELYHCRDKANWGGWLGREIRANVIPGLKDPIGLAATVWKTITDIDRIKLYLKRINRGY
jgi:hypothetical protein